MALSNANTEHITLADFGSSMVFVLLYFLLFVVVVQDNRCFLTDSACRFPHTLRRRVKIMFHDHNVAGMGEEQRAAAAVKDCLLNLVKMMRQKNKKQ